MMRTFSAILPPLAPWQARSSQTTLKTRKSCVYPPIPVSIPEGCSCSTVPPPPFPPSPLTLRRSCTTHLPAIPKCSLSGQEQPLRALQIILGEAIEVPTKPTHLALVGAWHVHLHLGLPIPQHLCREAGTDWAVGKNRDPRKPTVHPGRILCVRPPPGAGEENGQMEARLP